MHTSPEHWSIAVDVGRIAWVTLDKSDSGSNTLSSSVLAELSRVLDWLEKRRDLRGIVFVSGKESGFILGADITEFGQLEDEAEASRAAGLGQGVMQRIASLPCPSVAVINGFALGGGLELALACTYRVAAHSYDQTLGLPEVQLGIHPGFGGSVRIIELLGPLMGLDLMLTGRRLSPVQAARCGLVDRTVDVASARFAAIELLQRRPRRRRAAWYLRLLNYWPLRPVVARRVLDTVRRKANRRHYPAPYAIVALWEKYGANGVVAYLAEVESISRLLVTPTCRNLVRVFRLRERLRNLSDSESSATHVHVIGAGVMGGDIAAWCALNGLTVSLQDREQRFIDPAIDRADKLFARRLRAPGAAEAAARRIVPDLDGSEAAQADVVIEAIVENADIKREVFATVEGVATEGAILATNTSSILVEDIAAGLANPERLVGIHFFNPVAQLPLVEVVSSPETDPDVAQRAVAFVTRIGKLPLPCSSAPGFVVNRVLMPYMLEALRAHEDGIAFEEIDEAATNFGMPMGPIELADRVGLDVALHVAEILGAAFGSSPPESLRSKVAAGQLGVKSDAGGFYRYKDGRPIRSRTRTVSHPDLEDRLILPLVNECIACLHDRVVPDADLIDAGVVFGTGFAPFRGGPIQYARTRGVEEVIERLQSLQARYGDRFEPNPGWSDFLQKS